MSAAQFCAASNPLANTSLSIPTTVPLSSVLASPRFRGKLPTPPAGSAELIDALLSISGELRVGVCALPPASDECAAAPARLSLELQASTSSPMLSVLGLSGKLAAMGRRVAGLGGCRPLARAGWTTDVSIKVL